MNDESRPVESGQSDPNLAACEAIVEHIEAAEAAFRAGRVADGRKLLQGSRAMTWAYLTGGEAA